MASALTAASAQVWIGGDLEYQMNSSTKKSGDTNKSETFNIAPEVGYDLNNKWSVAAKLQFTHNYGDNGEINNSISISPYVRYYYYEFDKVRLLIDGGMNAGTTHVRGTESNINTFGLFLKPGVAYELNDRFGIEAHIGSLDWNKEKNYSDFRLKLHTSLILGFYVNL